MSLFSSVSAVTVQDSMITWKHVLDRLDLLICPFRNKSGNTVKIIVITCSSSCSSVGRQRPGERIPANSWSVRKMWEDPLPGGASPWPCFLLPVATKGSTLSEKLLSVPYLASRGAGSTGAAAP